MFHVTRRYKFSASHRLHSQSLSERDNAELYGKCNNPFGHGHDYGLEVTVRGPLDSSGRVVDVRTLDELVRAEVLSALEDRNMNVELPEFSSGECVPTTENLTLAIRDRLERAWPLPGVELARVHLRETRKNKFETRIYES
jgi:6-pyruvoyltetrahydropterin/6-carboxytetrahydropterin synthase